MYFFIESDITKTIWRNVADKLCLMLDENDIDEENYFGGYCCFTDQTEVVQCKMSQ